MENNFISLNLLRSYYENRDGKQILKDLLNPVALADFFDEGIRDFVGLAGIHDISGSVLFKHSLVGVAILLAEIIKQEAN